MTKKTKHVKVPAIKRPSGKIVRAKSQQQGHPELNRSLKRGEDEGERGFILSDGKFAGRRKAAKVAVAAGQVPGTIKRLHSEHLRKHNKRAKPRS